MARRAVTGTGPEPHKFRRDIQGLRALAVLLVVLFHAGLPVPGGYVGVDVFFVISGYVIGTLLLGELRTTGSISMRRFYARRVVRLLPALALLLVVVMGASVFLLSPFGPQQVTDKTGEAASVFLANTYLYSASGDYFADASVSNPLLHTWSLSVEEQFYLLLPLGLLLLWRVSRSIRRGDSQSESTVFMGIAAFCVVSLILSVAAGFGLFGREHQESIATLSYYAIPFRSWEFLAGVLLAFKSHRFTTLGRRTGMYVFGLGLLCVVGSALLFDETTSFPGVAAMVPVVGAGLMIAAGLAVGGTGPVGRVIACKPAVSVGNVSYAWYLWHWPAIVITGVLWPSARWLLPVAALLSLIPAFVSYRMVERPIRARSATSLRMAPVLAVACIAVPLVAATALQIGAERSWGLEVADDLSEQRLARPCTDTELVFPRERCVWHADEPIGTIAVVGDSHALSLGDGAVAAGNSLGFDVAVWARSGCPFLGIDVYGDAACAEFQSKALELALTADVVIVANRSTGYTFPPIGEGSKEDPWRTLASLDGTPASTQEEALESWSVGMKDVLDPLTAAGIPVLWVQQPPEFAENFATLVSIVRPEPVAASTARRVVDLRRAEVTELERDVLSGFDATSWLDPVSLLCDAETCDARRSDHYIFMDHTHLNPRGSLLLEDDIRDAVLALWQRR